MVQSWPSATSASLVAGTTGMYHHTQLISVFLVEMGFHHVGQDGLELLTSGDLPTYASQSAGIRGVSHRAWPISNNLYYISVFIILMNLAPFFTSFSFNI